MNCNGMVRYGTNDDDDYDHNYDDDQDKCTDLVVSLTSNQLDHPPYPQTSRYDTPFQHTEDSTSAYHSQYASLDRDNACSSLPWNYSHHPNTSQYPESYDHMSRRRRRLTDTFDSSLMANREHALEYPGESSEMRKTQFWDGKTILWTIAACVISISLRPFAPFLKSYLNTNLHSVAKHCPLSIKPALNHGRQQRQGLSEEWSHSELEEYFFRKGIVGQDHGLALISSTLESWFSGGENDLTPSYGEKPLSFLFMGSEGVGKSFTAEIVTKLLLSDCISKYGNEKIDSILRLEANRLIYTSSLFDESSNYVEGDFGDGSEPLKEPFKEGKLKEVESRDLFAKQLVNHVHQQGDEGGSVIIINEVEKLTEEMKLILSSTLENTRLSYYDDGLKTTVEADFSRSLFILMTNCGSTEILRHLVKSRNKSSVDLNLLRSDLQDVRLAKEGNVFSTTGKYQSYIGTIIPFLPLVKNDFFGILEYKISTWSAEFEAKQWNRLVVSDEALELFVELAKIPFLSIGPLNEILFAKYGAHNFAGFNGVQHILQNHVNRHFLPWRPDELAIIDVDGNSKTKVTFGWCKSRSLGNDEIVEADKVVDMICNIIWKGYLT